MRQCVQTSSTLFLAIVILLIVTPIVTATSTDSTAVDSTGLPIELFFGPSYTFSSNPSAEFDVKAGGVIGGLLPITERSDLRLSIFWSPSEVGPIMQRPIYPSQEPIMGPVYDGWRLSWTASYQYGVETLWGGWLPQRVFGYSGLGQVLVHRTSESKQGETEDGRDLIDKYTVTDDEILITFGAGVVWPISNSWSIVSGVGIEANSYKVTDAGVSLSTLHLHLLWR